METIKNRKLSEEELKICEKRISQIEEENKLLCDEIRNQEFKIDFQIDFNCKKLKLEEERKLKHFNEVLEQNLSVWNTLKDQIKNGVAPKIKEE